MNITISAENCLTEKELSMLHTQVLENRVYKEIHTFAHDLKTPLVTICGLNSLLALSQDKDKILNYAERIESSVEKMSNLMSNFLFEDARTQVTVEAFWAFVSAQVPIENEHVLLTINLENDLPILSVNIIRLARAFINIIENAILVATHNPVKKN